MFFLADIQLPAEFPPLNHITSIAGVALATTAIMQLIKKTLGDKDYFNRIPCFCYVITVSLILTYLANCIFKTLSGNFLGVAWHCICAALASSGSYTWVKKAKDGIDTTAPTCPPVAPVPPPVVVPMPVIPEPIQQPSEVIFLHIKNYEKPKRKRKP